MHSETLSNLVAHHWTFTHVVPGPVLQRNSTRSIASIHCDQGSFVVKTYANAWVLGLGPLTATEIDQRLQIFDNLGDNDFRHAPLLVKTRTGARFIRANGTTTYILEQLAGTAPPATPTSWAQLGNVAARLNACIDYPHAFGIPVAGAIAELTRQADRYPFRDDFLQLVSSLDVLVDQPACLIHGEINTANSMCAPGGTMYLIDWDQAGTGPWALELGYPLITHFLSEDLVFSTDSATAFYHAWSKGQAISAERREVVFTAALLHALRYLEFGDPFRRWNRIRYALDHKDELLATLGA